MEAKAKLTEVTRDWRTGRFKLTFEAADDIEHELDAISGDRDLRLIAKRWREKRSLNANDYAWVLMSAIARKLKTSKEEIYEIVLQDVGIPEETDTGPVTVILRPDVPAERLPGHWKRLGEVNGGIKYMMLKGSSEMDTEEMAALIDYIVEIAKEQGIDTATPDEIARYKALWEIEA